jgi:thioredoxin-like negative regulator of GroEL
VWGKVIAALLDLFDQVGRYLSDRQLIDAGKAENQVKAQSEVEAHVTLAQEATAVPDPARAQRLRDKYDDASG